MIEVILVFLLMLTLVGAMSVGVIFGRQPISGTCGGLNRMGTDGACEICGGNPALCDADEDATARAYDATVNREE